MASQEKDAHVDLSQRTAQGVLSGVVEEGRGFRILLEVRGRQARVRRRTLRQTSCPRRHLRYLIIQFFLNGIFWSTMIHFGLFPLTFFGAPRTFPSSVS